jgi:hypothetical protein
VKVMVEADLADEGYLETSEREPARVKKTTAK